MRTTRTVKIQLAAIAVVAIVSTIVLSLVFLRVPEALGIRRYQVEAEFDVGAGLYEAAEVTYLGSPVGKVDKMTLERDRIVVVLKLKEGIDIPEDVAAEVRSRSAVGEQYVDLVPPDNASSQVLADGARIGRDRTSVPIEIGAVLDNANELARSLDAKDLNTTLTQTDAALRGRSGDLQAIIDRGGSLLAQASKNIEPTKRLLADAEPLLTTVNGRRRNIVSLTDNLAQVTAELRAGDDDLRRILADGPNFSRETVRLLNDVDERLPALLKPLNILTDVLVRYDDHLAATLTEYPRSLATVQSVTGRLRQQNQIELTLSNINDPPECTKGFIPPPQWLSPFADNPDEIPPLVYCKESADDPRGVRGARNLLCPESSRRTGVATACREARRERNP